MIVTPRLQEHFDSNRKEVSKDTLNYLLSLGIDKRFAEQCEAMFQGIKADVREVIAVSPIIRKENDDLQRRFSKMDLTSSIEKTEEIKESANDRAYGGIKKVA